MLTRNAFLLFISILLVGEIISPIYSQAQAVKGDKEDILKTSTSAAKLFQKVQKASRGLEEATKALQAAKGQDAPKFLDQGQASVRILLNSFREEGPFMRELRLSIEHNKRKMEEYKRRGLPEEALNNILQRQQKIIQAFESAQKEGRSQYEKLKQIDRQFNQKRDLIAIDFEQQLWEEAKDKVGEALKEAGEATESMEKYLSSHGAPTENTTVE